MSVIAFPSRFVRLDALEADLEMAQHHGQQAAGYIRDAAIVGGDSSCYTFMAYRAYAYAVRAAAAARRAIPELR